METSAQSSGDHQEQHVSVQEMQELKETLNQAETKSKSLESQVENLQKVWLRVVKSVCVPNCFLVKYLKYVLNTDSFSYHMEAFLLSFLWIFIFYTWMMCV